MRSSDHYGLYLPSLVVSLNKTKLHIGVLTATMVKTYYYDICIGTIFQALGTIRTCFPLNFIVLMHICDLKRNFGYRYEDLDLNCILSVVLNLIQRDLICVILNV